MEPTFERARKDIMNKPLTKGRKRNIGTEEKSTRMIKEKKSKEEKHGFN